MKRLLFLVPLMIQRATGWLPFQPKPGKVQFANIGEGTYPRGVKTYLADASAINSPAVHFLLYKKSAAPPAGTAAADYVTLCTANTDIPLGPSDDGAKLVGDLLAINLLGAVRGTIRVVTDGTIADGDYVMPSALTVTPVGASAATAGAVAKYVVASTNRLIGKAVIPSDSTAEAGATIEMIPMAPTYGTTV